MIVFLLAILALAFAGFVVGFSLYLVGGGADVVAEDLKNAGIDDDVG